MYDTIKVKGDSLTIIKVSEDQEKEVVYSDKGKISKEEFEAIRKKPKYKWSME